MTDDYTDTVDLRLSLQVVDGACRVVINGEVALQASAEQSLTIATEVLRATWIPIDANTAELIGVDVAFSNGLADYDLELCLDERGWYSRTDEGRPIGGYEDDRWVATHYRPHMRPAGPVP